MYAVCLFISVNLCLSLSIFLALAHSPIRFLSSQFIKTHSLVNIINDKIFATIENNLYRLVDVVMTVSKRTTSTSYGERKI